MTVASVENRMKRLTKAGEVRLSSVTEMARETVGWDTPMSSPLHSCIFPVAKYRIVIKSLCTEDIP